MAEGKNISPEEMEEEILENEEINDAAEKEKGTPLSVFR